VKHRKEKGKRYIKLSRKSQYDEQDGFILVKKSKKFINKLNLVKIR